VIELQIPSITDRPDDILPLAEHFLATLPREEGVVAASLGESARDALLQHEWPGNVRELQNRIHRATLVCAGKAITPDHLGLGAVTPPRPTAELGRADPVRSPAPDHGDPDRIVVEDALTRAGGSVSKAAADLGVSRQALYRRMERVGLVLERRPKA
jgi:DNA-binding NtrC family response regulator